MLSATGGELSIGLGPEGIALLHRQGWLRQRSRVIDECRFADTAPVPADELAAALDRLLSTSGGQGLPARLVLADEWARHWMVTPPANASRLADCRAAAAARFQALYGEPLAAWQWAADWDARLPFLASALPQALVVALCRVCAAHQLVLLEVVPQFVAAWNRWRRSLQGGRWFGVLLGRNLTLGAVGDGRLCALRSQAVPAAASVDAAWLQQALEREALRWMLAPPTGLQLCGAPPAAWAAAATGGWCCTRVDRDFVSDASAPQAGAAAALPPAVRLAATGWR
jgi:hypothetical protein